MIEDNMSWASFVSALMLGLILGFAGAAIWGESRPLRPGCEHPTYAVEMNAVLAACDTYGCVSSKGLALRTLRGCK